MTEEKDLTSPLPETEEFSSNWQCADLIAITGELAGRRFTIGASPVVIGRDPSATISIPSDDVSRRHAMIQRTAAGEFVIEDLNSRNCTLVNGVPIEVHVLQLGEKIQVGSRALFVFTHHSALEEQLVRWQRVELISRVAAGVVHDFNNCLSILLGNVEFLQMATAESLDRLDPDALRECLAEMMTAIEQGNSLTSRMLAFARDDQIPTVPVDLGATVAEAVKLLRRNLGDDIAVDTVIDGNLRVLGDRTQLLQVIINLLLNARDAMPDGGKLRVEANIARADSPSGDTRVLRRGEQIRVAITDTGTGMDATAMKRAFEPLFTTKAAGKGTGLGLSTVHRLVEQHGGQVDFTSEKGKGTTFVIYLPPMDSVAAKAKTTMVGEPVMAVRDERIVLLIDDDETVRERVRRTLHGFGYEVICADGPADAIVLFEKYARQTSLVILNLDLKTIDATETCDRLRKIHSMVKILACTGSEEQRTRAILTAGIRDVLSRPFGSESLRSAFSTLIDNN